nr:MAG TPA: hypothetical protein [Caudoviricetes sp.]
MSIHLWCLTKPKGAAKIQKKLINTCIMKETKEIAVRSSYGKTNK